MVQARSMAAVMPVLGGTGANGPYQPLPQVEEIYRRALSVGGASQSGTQSEELKRVVWVSHGGVIRSWRCFVNGVDLADSLKFAVSYFGCMEFERGPDGVWREVKGEHQIV
jgi:broad specificity phosphatase PhoE